MKNGLSGKGVLTSIEAVSEPSFPPLQADYFGISNFIFEVK
jgi:hypothetical protein